MAQLRSACPLFWGSKMKVPTMQKPSVATAKYPLVGRVIKKNTRDFRHCLLKGRHVHQSSSKCFCHCSTIFSLKINIPPHLLSKASEFVSDLLFRSHSAVCSPLGFLENLFPWPFQTPLMLKLSLLEQLLLWSSMCTNHLMAFWT